MRVLVVTAMYPTPASPAAGTFVKEQVESLLRAGIDVEVMVLAGAGSLGRYLRGGLELRRRLRRDPVDIVHAHYGLAGLAACLQRDCPVVITYHGSDLLGEVSPAGRYTWGGRGKVLLSQMAGSLAAQRIVVAEILRHRLWQRDSVVIPMGVDCELFRPRPRAAARRALGIDDAARIVLFLANPAVGVKRYDVAKAAVDLLAAEDPGVQLLPVCGVPHEQIPQYMNASDVLVMTSNHEASPCAIKEALACNLPIVSVRVGDVPERIANVAGCFLCDRTPADVAAKLRLALAGGRTSGRESVQAIDLENTARRTIAVYREVLGRRPGRGRKARRNAA